MIYGAVSRDGLPVRCIGVFFFFNAPATSEIYTLSLHDALPICSEPVLQEISVIGILIYGALNVFWVTISLDRKSTRLNSSHRCISYAVFCLKKKSNR